MPLLGPEFVNKILVLLYSCFTLGFSKALRQNAAPAFEGLNALWKRSQTPAPRIFIGQHTRNVSGWLASHLDTIERHSKPHCFEMVKNDEGNVEVSWKK